MKKKIVSKVFALLLAACTVLSACGNESGNQSVGQTDKSETNTKLFSLQNYLNRILLDIQFMTQSMAGSAEAANALGKMPTITVRMAIAVIGILPLMMIFPFFQSYFARGMTVGAVKG